MIIRLRTVGPLALVMALWFGLGGVQPAAAQDGPQIVELEAVMAGEIEGLTTEVTGNGGYSGPSVRVNTSNTSGRDYQISVRPGSLLAPDTAGTQTMVVAGPNDDESDGRIISTSSLPAMAIPAGTTTHVLNAYCAQANDSGPSVATVFSFDGVAKDPLPSVMKRILETDPDWGAAQDAVWFITDNANPDTLYAESEALLQDISIDDYASSPTRVVPDENYSPELIDRVQDDSNFLGVFALALVGMVIAGGLAVGVIALSRGNA